MDVLAGSLDNLVIVATTNRTTVQQLTLANLLLTTLVATLLAANKKLTKMVACYNPAPQGCSSGGGRRGNNACCGPKAIWGNYCWTHGYKVLHNSKTCNEIGKKPGHDEDATVADTKGGADSNKDWYLQGNRAPWQCGIASMVENNDLLNLLKLAVTALDSCNPTQLPPKNNSGIAASGLMGFYFGPDAPISNYDTLAPTLEVQVAKGTPVRSIASAELASVPDLPASSQVGHVMPIFPHNLIGLAPFADAGCQVIFTQMSVITFDANDKAILINWRETTGSQLWHWPLIPQHPTAPSLPGKQRLLMPAAHDSQLDTIDRLRNIITLVCNRPLTLSWQPMQLSVCAALLEQLGRTSATDATGIHYEIEFQYNTTAFTVMASSKGGYLPYDPHRIDLPSIPALVAFYHACLDFQVKDMWLEAIKAGNCDTFAGLSYANMACSCLDSDKTILGHLAQTQQNVQSTKPQLTSRPNPPSIIETPTPLAEASQEVFLHVYPISKLYTDDTGCSPVWARLGHQYFMIAYHMDGNLILQQAFQTKANKHHIPAFNTIMERLAACRLLMDLNIRDNEASADFKQVITESWKTKFQLVPLDMHRRNKAKRMIQHFKNHFLSILAGVDAAFPPYL
jgi:hypothetical protein